MTGGRKVNRNQQRQARALMRERNLTYMQALAIVRAADGDCGPPRRSPGSGVQESPGTFRYAEALDEIKGGGLWNSRDATDRRASA